MNAVGIDVSKGKSMVTILRPFGEIVSSPFEIKHTSSDIHSLIKLIHSIEGESRVVMEHTGRYYEALAHQLSAADLFVSAVNPTNANTYFNSPTRSDGSQKWVDFVSTYWHVDCIRKMSLNAFVEHYQNWCKRKKYAFNKSKAEEIYTKTKELVPVFPKNEITKHIIRQAIDQLNSTSVTVETIRTLMNETASKLPEYSIVMQFKGIGPSLGPQLMAEIGDVTRFTHKGALTAFAGVDPGVNESGSYAQKSVPTSKRGSSNLRKTLFQVMDVLIKTMPQDDPVYQFMDRKRTQGKPYYVYMTAGANKFLRIYYGRVKEYLSVLPDPS
ncbi:MAG: transposase [Ruminococcus sp.]|nr:transposase [Ruminococcus sp.]